VKDGSGPFAKRVVAAYESAIKTRLAAIALEQNSQREAVAQNRMEAAQTALQKAQSALTEFESKNKLASPVAQLGVGIGVLANLQGEYDAKEVELHSLQQFATANNIQVTALKGQLSALQSQIEHARTAAGGSAGPTLQGITSKSPEFFNLIRNQAFEESLVQVYSKYLEETKIDSLSASSTVIEIEPPYIEPARQYNSIPIGLLILTCLLFVLSEFYFWRPPVGAA
jgi:capsule polysaccharide export protein KpsE/RkpR